MLDPRVQRENTGAERLDATRLGVANIQRSLERLDEATGGNRELFVATLGVMLDTQKKLLDSVATLVGGAMPHVDGGAVDKVDLVPADEQSAAVYYLLGEGARSLEPFTAANVVDRISVAGGDRGVAAIQQGLLTGLLTGPRIAVLQSQSQRSESAYSPIKFGHDVATAVWDNLEQAAPTDRVLQRAYLAQTRQLIADWSNAAEKESASVKVAVAAGFPPGFSAIESDTGDDTDYPAWLRSYLPQLKARLDVASRQAMTESDRLHFGEMARQVQQLMAALQ